MTDRRPSDPRPHRRSHRPDSTEPVRKSAPLPPEMTPGGPEPWWRNVNRQPGQLPRVTRQPPPPPPTRLVRPPAAPAAARTPSSSPPPQRRQTTPLLVGLSIPIVLALGVVVGLVVSDVEPAPMRVLDIDRLEHEVTRILIDPVDGYGVNEVADIVCNGGEPPAIQPGAELTCQTNVDGARRTVLVVIQDDVGTYSVDRPR